VLGRLVDWFGPLLVPRLLGLAGLENLLNEGFDDLPAVLHARGKVQAYHALQRQAVGASYRQGKPYLGSDIRFRVFGSGGFGKSGSSY
jgi:hypothetical protein